MRRTRLNHPHSAVGGWLARAGRIIEEGDLDFVERGWLLVPPAIHCIDEDPATAHATFDKTAEIGARFDDPDLVTMALTKA